MSERIWAYCDYCNPQQLQLKDGRGYTEMPEQDAIENLMWKMTEKGVMCLDCQDERDDESKQIN